MIALRIRAAAVTAPEIAGRVLTHDLSAGLRKGRVLAAADADAVRSAGVAEIHVVELEAGDVHEDQAARRLAAALVGDGAVASEPVQSQVRLLSTRRGLVRVDRSAVEEMNGLPAIGVFTLVDGQAVSEGEEVAGAKVTPVAIEGAVLESAEAIAARHQPVVRVAPFRALRTAVVVTEKLRPKARQAFAEAVTVKLGWYGAQLAGVREVARSGRPVRAAYEDAAAGGTELILFAGASSIDPLDAAYSELEAAGGQVLHQGVPAHPGSMLWLGRLGTATVLGVASCAGFGRNTALDLVLPFVFADGGITPADLKALGYGGLIESGAGRRFPPYSAR